MKVWIRKKKKFVSLEFHHVSPFDFWNLLQRFLGNTQLDQCLQLQNTEVLIYKNQAFKDSTMCGTHWLLMCPGGVGGSCWLLECISYMFIVHMLGSAKTHGTKWVNNLFQFLWREPLVNFIIHRESVFRPDPMHMSSDQAHAFLL